MPQPTHSLFRVFLHYAVKSVFFTLFGSGVWLWLFYFYDRIDLFIKNINEISLLFDAWKLPVDDRQAHALCNAQKFFFNILIALIGGIYAWKTRKKWRSIFSMYLTAYLSIATIIVIYPLKLGVAIFPFTFLIGIPCEVVDVNRAQRGFIIFYDLRQLFGIELTQ